jgi:prephenate dehydratase
MTPAATHTTQIIGPLNRAAFLFSGFPMAVSQLVSSRAIPRVAFEGEFGAFSEEAIARLWPDAEAVPTRTVGDVARAVSSGTVDAGIMPVENTLAGGVVAAYDALADTTGLHAVGETILAIRQCLMAPAGATLETIDLVESHPVALAQCSMFLARFPHVRAQPTYDTAGAARAVAGARDPRRAAIASRHAATRYGLVILADHIEDRPDNQTRFLAVARDPVRLPQDTPSRTSLVFTTANEPGALLRVLEPLASHHLNLSKLESRPTGEPWTYRFFADIDHAAGDPHLVAALSVITTATQTCRILGTYARALS